MVIEISKCLHSPFCHLRPLFNTVHDEFVRWWIVVIALLPSLCAVQAESSDASRQFRASPSRWRNASESVWKCDAKLALFSNFHPIRLKQLVVNGRGGSLAQHKVGTLAFLRPSPRFHHSYCVARLRSLFGPRLNPHWPALNKRLISSSGLTHRVKTLFSRCSSEMYWMHWNKFTKSFKCCYKKRYWSNKCHSKNKKRHLRPHLRFLRLTENMLFSEFLKYLLYTEGASLYLKSFL